ncbi:MAG: argininosuccinate lyase [Candidatus Glassbacteria bacterium]|nr:argininosuccinate lyase [Candidatus Glassbacteria bacterium]
MWAGRFSEGTDPLLVKFNASIGFDRRMWREDIAGSRAYAAALERAGLITAEECGRLDDGLRQVAEEIESGKFSWSEKDEDIHMAVERRLTEIAGPVGGKLHTGRSRNDQVATDMRLWVKCACREIDRDLRMLMTELLEQARPHVSTLMPGFTHLQQAQVVSAAHYLLSFFWMFERDRGRFRDTAERADELPLGSGALAGNAIGIDRQFLARELGFGRVSANSMDAVSDRDFVVEFISAASLAMVHLAHLAEDLIVYSSQGYSFVALSDSFTTGSSLMPQKKNPDSLELVRGKCGRVTGRLTGLLATLKGLPSTYNKDLQEDKEPLFDSFDTLRDSLRITAGVVATMEFRAETMRACLDEFQLATDLADYLVARGMPFRQAHEVVGKLVRECEDSNTALSELPLESYQRLSELFEEDVRKILDFDTSLASREASGGSAPEAVERQLAAAADALAGGEEKALDVE